MSLENRWNPPARSTSDRGRRRAITSNADAYEPPIYIRGFPGFDALKNNDQSNVSAEIESNFETSNPRFNVHDSDLDNLVDFLQIKEDHNDRLATRPRAGFAPVQRRNTIHTSKTSSPYDTELTTLYISMFHTGFCKIDKKHNLTPYGDNLKRFFTIYMRNHEDTEVQRCERQYINDFKRQQHDKLSKEEWNYLCSFIKHMDFNQNHKAFEEFCSILRDSLTSLASSPFASLSSSPDTLFNESSPSSLTQSLSKMSSGTAQIDNTIRHSMDEIRRLYVSIYYPNYQEFWNSDVFVLSTSLEKAIDGFLDTYPFLHSSVVDKLHQSMSTK